ncbi:hypothetical protein MDA_GLEAN10008494 [Myotis davidii]|uniref:Uncharacterized protein n=1 Tax=Myotis davidii TaxID=225400 RepID=L5MC07_MYODS|nr:hypothetical protein MDA_GLEAN10008494 [Myotis davidii]
MDARREEKRPLAPHRPPETAGSEAAHAAGPRRSHPGSRKETAGQLLILQNHSKVSSLLKPSPTASGKAIPVLPPQYASVMHLDLTLHPSAAISFNVRTMSKSLPENSEDPEVFVE